MEDLKSGIEHLRQAKAHMSKANGIMSDHISKLKALEEENAELRAKLEALIQSDDSYMKLPLDADGMPIRIGDKMDVDGEAMTVLGYRLHNGTLFLIVKESGSIITYSPKPSSVRHFKYVPPDSWEKLEEDASVGAQDYCANWLGIDIRKTLTSDDDEAFAKDIIRRAKKLAGIEEEAE
jgi:hypothetical protein